MGIAERRAKEKENLRRAILDAARELFVTQGYEAVSMRKIAERIEYSPTAIYLYFKDKDAILGTLIDEGFDALCQEVQALHGIADPVKRLWEGARRYIRFALAHPHYYRLMFEMVDSAETLGTREHKRESAMQAFGFIRRCVAEGMAQGRFRADREENILSHTTWAHVHGAVALALAHRLEMLTPEQQEAFFDSVADAAVRGIMPDCPPSSPTVSE
jgi:AcrR family transcriptional regulator